MSSRDPGSSDRSGSEPPDQQEPFLQRWSRRKAAARQGTDPAPIEPPLAESSQELVAPDDEPSPRVLTDEDMPTLDTLNESSDVSGFMSPGVSEQLRRAALRKVFSMAVYNVRDGLDDYDEDFTTFEPLGDTVTADMKHRAEMLEKRRREREEEERLAAENAEREQTAALPPDEQHGEAPAEAEDEGGDPQAIAPTAEDEGGDPHAIGPTAEDNDDVLPV